MKLGKCKYRNVSLQIGTGDLIELRCPYYEKKYHGSLHDSSCYGYDVLFRYWCCLGKSSPSYYSRCGLLSVICPSFDIGLTVLKSFGVSGTYDRMRKLSLMFGNLKNFMGVGAGVAEDESLEGKRVVIQYDGGRSRVRIEKGALNEKGNRKYDTPWKEPHLFVINCLDKEGNVCKQTRVHYGVSMGNNGAAIEDLLKTLEYLDIAKAESVQFVADGAQVIWKDLRKKLINLGLESKKITFTLDYYHAVQHLNVAIKAVEKDEKEQKMLLKMLKDKLWYGSIYFLIDKLKSVAQNNEVTFGGDIERECNYFKKHQDSMKYNKFRAKKLLCGSGMVESAIRRIINLRFKSSSSFWREENLEPLMFLRATFLAKRWNIFLENAKKYLRQAPNWRTMIATLSA